MNRPIFLNLYRSARTVMRLYSTLFYSILNILNSRRRGGAPLPSVSSTGDTQKIEKERQLAHWKGGEGGGRGADSYDRKKACPSINHSILSGLYILTHYIYFLLTTQ